MSSPFSLAAAAVLVSGVSAPAGAVDGNPIQPDNRPTTIVGATNGAVPDSELLQVSPSCLAYYRAAPSLISLLAAAHRDGIRLAPEECYRDYAGQVQARNDWCARGACDMAAVPGTSNHGWGKAVDLRDQSGELTFDSAGYAWLKAHAGWFGWNHPGVMEPGGSVPEPWHWEWVGDGGRMFPGQAFGFGSGFGIGLGGNPVGALRRRDPDLVERLVRHDHRGGLGDRSRHHRLDRCPHLCRRCGNRRAQGEPAAR